MINREPLIFANKLAKYVISYVYHYAEEQYKFITNLKLQKILYYIEGYYMANFGYSLYPALIEAWKFGPVLPSVYYEYSVFGADPITLSIAEMEDSIREFNLFVKDDNQRKFINCVIAEKMNTDVWELVKATHSEAPWLNATHNGTQFGMIISKRSMMQYFSTTQK